MEVVLIPAYKPDQAMLRFVRELAEAGLSVLIVDDGSGPEFASLFSAAEEYAVVLHQPCNTGKGAALKRGMAQLLDVFPDCTYFTTADADGQHRTSDILRLTKPPYADKQFVLTERDLTGPIPRNSRLGNMLSRWVFTLVGGRYYDDNQSGLRRFAVSELEWLLKVGGDKYDYEMNMLYYAEKQHIRVTTMPIDAIYIDGNSSSHFQPLQDTLRIYQRLFSSATASLLCALLAELTLLVANCVPAWRFTWMLVPLVGLGYAALTTILNRTWLFRNVPYRDAPYSLFSAAIRWSFYTGMCKTLCLLPIKIPIFLQFNLVLLISAPIKFLILRGIKRRRDRDLLESTL